MAPHARLMIAHAAALVRAKPSLPRVVRAATASRRPPARSYIYDVVRIINLTTAAEGAVQCVTAGGGIHPMSATRERLGIATVIVIVAGAIASAANG